MSTVGLDEGMIRQCIHEEKNERDQERGLFDDLHEPLTPRPLLGAFLIPPALPAVMIVEAGRPMLELLVHEVTGLKVVSMHHDIGTVTGEEVIVFSLTDVPQCPTARSKNQRTTQTELVRLTTCFPRSNQYNAVVDEARINFGRDRHRRMTR